IAGANATVLSSFRAADCVSFEVMRREGMNREDLQQHGCGLLRLGGRGADRFLCLNSRAAANLQSVAYWSTLACVVFFRHGPALQSAGPCCFQPSARSYQAAMTAARWQVIRETPTRVALAADSSCGPGELFPVRQVVLPYG